jgi:type IX secretion system PorP/SprF family membrane protein
MKKLNYLFLLVLYLMQPCDSFAQDYSFTQFFQAPLSTNPAYSGLLDRDYRAILQYRNQWNGLGEAWRTMGASYDMSLLKKPRKTNFLGAGGFIFNDQAGKSKMGTMVMSGAAAWHMSIDNYNSISFGLSAGYTQRSISIDGLAWDSQYNGIAYDPTLASGENFSSTALGFPDAGYGLVWSYQKDSKFKYDVGISSRHFFQGQSFLEGGNDKLYPLHILHGSGSNKFGDIKLDYFLRISNQAMSFNAELAGLLHYRLGMDSKFTNSRTSSAISAGFLYRHGDAVAAIVGYEFKRSLIIFMSYDFTISKLSRYNNSLGGPEFSLKYEGFLTQDRIRLM